ncbi:MAG: AgmX/PglI C-terminal domain-containing protein [Archangiaceae bacterium]|nr:AgmX/PglI C-terminal domain-containing protein [Archangiaceae bacterium]
MSGQPSVLQVVILRDGLLVGTEVFVPGQYTLGSGDSVDLKLDDPSVAPSHATLYFQNGRAAIQDAGSGSVFVNGHRVNACEVRAVDEIACGPFTLKVRVLAQKPAAKPAPPPEVAALLGNPQAAPAAKPAAARPAAPQTPAPAKPAAPATVVSARRMNTPQSSDSAVTARATPALRAVQPIPVEEHEEKTESVALGADFLDPTGKIRPDPQMTVPLMTEEPPPPPPPSIPTPAVRAQPAPKAVEKPAPPPAPPAPAPAAAPVAAYAPEKRHDKHDKKAAPQSSRREGHHARPTPSIPPASEGKGRPHLFVELYWGETRRYASSHDRIDPKKKLIARDDDNAPLPLWGFGTEGSDFVFAEQQKDLFRVFVPSTAAVERRAQDGNFYPVGAESLEVGPGQRRCVTLGTGHAVRFTGDKEMTLVAYVQPALPRPFVNPLKKLPWLVLAFLALFGSAFMAFAVFAYQPESADFNAKGVPPVAVRLIAPPKKEEKKKIEEKIKELKKEKKEQPKVEKPVVAKAVPQETKKALKSVEKLVAAGPAMKDLLAAVDKLGSGPGAKNAKNDFKLSGLIGKAPIANAGIGTFGLGGGGAGGMGIKGAELLRGKGGAGIGALGAGNIGKGKVGGAVTSAVSRNVGAQGTIDKEAVAKAINAHLGEVSSCYERALLKEPGLAGKIVLEWQITTSGSVGFAKTKSSTMKSSAVEQCILGSLKTWRFPPAKGAGVVITYPFMFNSVGY